MNHKAVALSITMLRFILLPVVVYCFVMNYMPYALIAAAIIMISDVVDGWYARRFGCVSATGALLDPLADKLFISVMFMIFSMHRGCVPPLPYWFVWFYLTKELISCSAVGLLMGIRMWQGKPLGCVKASFWGKAAMVCESVLVWYLLCVCAGAPYEVGLVEVCIAGTVVCASVAFLEYGYHYLAELLR